MKCNLYEKDEQTHRTTIHFHLFRKYFLTEFKLAASAEVAEELADFLCEQIIRKTLYYILCICLVIEEYLIRLLIEEG